MNRLLKTAAALVCAFGFGITAHAQLTTVTATNISMGGTPISTGTVTFVPVDSRGTAISFATGGGGLNGPMGFSCVITAGAITGTCQVPDAALTTPANILYSIQVSDTSNGNKSSGKAFTLQQVANVTGSSWALDHYGPPASTTAVQALQVVYGAAAPPNPCLTPSVYIQSTNGGSAYVCVAGTPVLIGGSANSAKPILDQIPTNGLIGLYTYSDCSNPYKDYSGNGNDGTPASGISEPFCDAQGLHYYSPTVGPNAWKLPSSLTSHGLTYVFGIVPMVGGALGADYPSLVKSDSSGGTLGLYMNQSVKTTYGLGMGITASTTTTNSLTQIPVASTVSYEIGSGISGDKDQLFVNGVEQVYNAQGATTLAAFNVGNMLVGGPNNFNTFWGIISATAVYNRKLTSQEQMQVANAINNFDQMRTGLVYPEPMAADSVSKIVCDGDSITSGVGVPASWCSNNLLNVGESFNAIHPGATPSRYMTSLAQRAPQEMIPYYSPSAPKNTGYIFAGTNDLVNGVQTAANTWSAGIRAIANSRYGSAKIVWMPMMSRTGGDTAKNAYDTLTNAQCPNYADYCVAPTDPLLYADGANSGTVGTVEACPGATTYFQADCVHPTTAGQTLLALYASNAYKQLHGSTQAAPTQVSTATYSVTASDNYITATANSVITLYNCLGYSRFVAIKVLPGLTVTVKNATSAQTIDGVDHSSAALSLTAGSNYKFQVVPGDPSTGGCTWIIN